MTQESLNTRVQMENTPNIPPDSSTQMMTATTINAATHMLPNNVALATRKCEPLLIPNHTVTCHDAQPQSLSPTLASKQLTTAQQQ